MVKGSYEDRSNCMTLFAITSWVRVSIEPTVTWQTVHEHALEQKLKTDTVILIVGIHPQQVQFSEQIMQELFELLTVLVVQTYLSFLFIISPQISCFLHLLSI